jgi:hypothetical protein
MQNSILRTIATFRLFVVLSSQSTQSPSIIIIIIIITVVNYYLMITWCMISALYIMMAVMTSDDDFVHKDVENDDGCGANDDDDDDGDGDDNDEIDQIVPPHQYMMNIIRSELQTGATIGAIPTILGSPIPPINSPMSIEVSDLM